MESFAAFRTWEWGSDAQIRGYAHPGLFALFYKLLALLVRLLSRMRLYHLCVQLWH